MDTYCQLWFTICKWQFASSMHTDILLLFEIDFKIWVHTAQHSQRAAWLNILYTKCQTTSEIMIETFCFKLIKHFVVQLVMEIGRNKFKVSFIIFCFSDEWNPLYSENEGVATGYYHWTSGLHNFKVYYRKWACYTKVVLMTWLYLILNAMTNFPLHLLQQLIISREVK